MTSSNRTDTTTAPVAAASAASTPPRNPTPGTPAPDNTPRSDAPSALARLRKAHPAEILLPRTRAWLESIPEAVRPHQLAKRFPRVANQLAACWSSQGEWAHELDNLLNDKRGGRRGFPPEINTELLKLQHWHRTLTGGPSDHWHG